MNEMNWTLTVMNVNDIIKNSILWWFNESKYDQQTQINFAQI